MLIRRRKGWEIPEREATSESVYLGRRTLVRAMGLGGIALAAPGVALAEDDPSASKYPVRREDRFGAHGAITAEKLATTYNNYYEFDTDKSIWRAAQKLPIRPWTVKVSGKVEKPFEIGFDDLLAHMPLEERVYRHRCVETWSMIVPWSGFPMKSLVELCKPVGDPKYVVMQTLSNPKVMPGQKDILYPCLLYTSDAADD